MSNPNEKLILEPMNSIDMKLAKKARVRLQRECIANLRKIRIEGKGEKNLRKKIKRLFQDETISGFYIEEKNIYGMLVMFDEDDNKFLGAYISRVNGVLSLYESNLRFSLHAIERLIFRLNMKNPRKEIAKAIHSQTKFVFCPDKSFAINIEEKWRTLGLNDVDVATPYLDDNNELLGIFFLTSISNLSCTRVEAGVVKTFVDTNKLREKQYRQCMEVYEAQRKSFLLSNSSILTSRTSTILT
ncbi:hypothetical protein V8046_002891 [Vibrio parahaemolyticus]|nr:hypothetical protein [Vibrio parahaemolyticus]